MVGLVDYVCTVEGRRGDNKWLCHVGLATDVQPVRRRRPRLDGTASARSTGNQSHYTVADNSLTAIAPSPRPLASGEAGPGPWRSARDRVDRGDWTR